MCSSDPERNAIHLLDKDMGDMCASKLEKLCTPYFSVSCACCSMLNRLLPKCNDRNKKLKRPFSLRKLTNFTRKLANFGTFLKLKML